MSEKVLSLTRRDFTITSFRVGGHGGQKVNKTNAGARVVHRPSGAVAESRSSRSFDENRKIAFKKCAESLAFRLWVADVHANILKGKTVEEEVSEMMTDANLKVEFRVDGKWQEEHASVAQLDRAHDL